MAIKKQKPTSPARRFQTWLTNEDITRSEPEKSLVKGKRRTGGRNTHGRITSRHRGGKYCRNRSETNDIHDAHLLDLLLFAVRCPRGRLLARRLPLSPCYSPTLKELAILAPGGGFGSSLRVACYRVGGIP